MVTIRDISEAAAQKLQKILALPVFTKRVPLTQQNVNAAQNLIGYAGKRFPFGTLDIDFEKAAMRNAVFFKNFVNGDLGNFHISAFSKKMLKLNRSPYKFMMLPLFLVDIAVVKTRFTTAGTADRLIENKDLLLFFVQ